MARIRLEIDWRGRPFSEKLRRGVVRNLERAAITYKNELKRALSSRPGRRGKLLGKHRNVTIKNRSVSRRFGSKGRVLNLTARSRPGEMPRKQTGTLIQRISHEINRNMMLARVGTNLKYARYLEQGTAGGKIIRPKTKKVLANTETGQVFGKRVRKGPMAPRPYLNPMLKKLKTRLSAIITRDVT